MSGALEVPLKDLKDWLEQETVSVIKPLKDRGAGLLRDVRSKMDGIRETCEKLLEDSEREMRRGDPKTYRPARAANKLARKALETIERTVIPDEISHENLLMLQEDLEKMLVAIGRGRRVWFPQIKPYFIIDRRRFDAASRKMVESLEKLRTFSSQEYVRVKAVEEAFSMIGRLLQLLDELDEVEGRKKRVERRGKTLEKRIGEHQHKIALLRSRNELSELVRMNEEIEELKRKVKHNLRHLQKPFFKFQSLARSADVYLPLDEAKKLGEYLSDPFEALATEEEGYPLLKRILRRVDDAMARGKLKLKSSRLRKAREQMNHILRRDALTPLHRSCKEAFFQRQQLLTSEAIVKFQNELAQLQRELGDLQRRRELVSSRSAVLESEHERLLKKIKSQEKELQSIVLRLTGKNVRVVL
jgi:hypothetical protein